MARPKTPCDDSATSIEAQLLAASASFLPAQNLRLLQYGLGRLFLLVRRVAVFEQDALADGGSFGAGLEFRPARLLGHATLSCEMQVVELIRESGKSIGAEVRERGLRLRRQQLRPLASGVLGLAEALEGGRG
jgi:hypothetical protein